MDKNQNNDTREQKLEAALKQLIHLCATLRFRQRRWKQHYGSTNRTVMEASEKKMDDLLKQMGITEDMEFTQIKIKFLSELTVEEAEDLSKNLIK